MQTLKMNKLTFEYGKGSKLWISSTKDSGNCLRAFLPQFEQIAYLFALCFSISLDNSATQLEEANLAERPILFEL